MFEERVGCVGGLRCVSRSACVCGGASVCGVLLSLSVSDLQYLGRLL